MRGEMGLARREVALGGTRRGKPISGVFREGDRGIANGVGISGPAPDEREIVHHSNSVDLVDNLMFYDLSQANR